MHEPAFCPQCANALADGGRCPVCEKRVPHSSELVAQAEALFVSYLTARIVHARHRLTAAQRDLLRDPRSRTRREAVEQAEKEIARLQNQLVSQTRESQRAQRAAEQARLAAATRIDAPRPPTADERRCPRCAGSLPGAVNHCRCGYVVEAPMSAEPALFSSEVENIRPAKRPGKAK